MARHLRRLLAPRRVARTPSGTNSYIFKVKREYADLSCAGVQISHFSPLRRNHLGVFGKRVQGENPFAKGFFPWRAAS